MAIAPKRVSTYNPENVTVWIGSEIVTDFAKSSFISVAMTAKQFTYTSGLSTGVRMYDPEKHGTITLVLMQGSPSNVTLYKFLNEDIRNGRGFFPLLIKDNNSESAVDNTAWLCEAPTCWVTENPDWGYSSDSHQVRTWTLESGYVDYRAIDPYTNSERIQGLASPPESP